MDMAAEAMNGVMGDLAASDHEARGPNHAATLEEFAGAVREEPDRSVVVEFLAGLGVDSVGGLGRLK